MTIHPDLAEFVKNGLARSLPRDRIEQALIQAGWPGDQVAAALGGFADIEFPIPVPRPNPSVSAREAFIYLVMFTALYISAFSLGALAFQLIDLVLPDPALARPGAPAGEAIRWSVSLLAVTFPVFLYLARLVGREVTADPGRRASRVRRWLTYLTAFVAAGFLMGDVTTLVYNLLGGELALRFLLKALTVGVIAGTIFGYYRWDLKRDEGEAG